MRFKDNIVSGILAGILFPIITFVLLTQIYKLLDAFGATNAAGLASNFRERTSAILAIASNLLPMRIFQSRFWQDATRGIVIATGILAIAWVAYYGVQMMN
jgi:uncharacterized membrane protein (DUF485 family)